MQVLIVGSGGFLGTRLTSVARSSGMTVHEASSSDATTGLDRASGLVKPGFLIPNGVRAVIYLAQSPRRHQSAESAPHVLAVNVLSAVHVAALAIKAGVSKFIYASTGNVYQPSFAPLSESSPLRRDNWYSLSKVQAEEALQIFGGEMDVTAVRLFGLYGPHQTNRLVPTLADAVATGKPVFLERNPHDPADSDGMRISLCYVDDAVRIILALVERAGIPRLNVAGHEVLSVRGIANAIARAIGREPVFSLSTQARAFELIADVSLLRRTLGPTFTDFATGIRATLAASGQAAPPRNAAFPRI